MEFTEKNDPYPKRQKEEGGLIAFEKKRGKGVQFLRAISSAP